MRDLRLAATVALLFAAGLAGCVNTHETPLAPNMVRLDTHASGALFAGQATGQTVRRAAEVTVQNGYSHFRLEDAHVSSGSQFTGFYSTYLTGLPTPVDRPTTDVGVTVVMFHADEPGAKGAFDAAAVLKKYGE
jgi:hypothetical protein